MRLNESAAIIWTLCDGKRRLGEVAEILHACFSDNRHSVDLDLVGTVRQLVNARVLKLNTPNLTPHRGSTHELCILFLYHKPDSLTRRHLDMLNYFNPVAAIVPLCMNIPLKLSGPQESLDIGSLESCWDLSTPWRSCDALLYTWFLNRRISAHRYIYMEYDCLCTTPLSVAYRAEWNADVATRSYFTPATNPDWPWFCEIERQDADDRPFAAGVPPLAGFMLSHNALEAISHAATRRDIYCELRVGTTANRLGIKPRTFSGTLKDGINWNPRPLDCSLPGVFHPVKYIVN
jgi:hypothetical protein